MDGLHHPVPAALVDELFRASRGDRWGLSRAAFEAALPAAIAAQKAAYASGEPQAAMRRFLEKRKT